MFSLTQSELKKFMSKFLKATYSEVYEMKDFICAVGDIPIALVAHLDTVFTRPPKEFYFDQKKNVLWSPQGLGADDRAGVFSLLTIIKSGLKPHIILTTNEEIGGVGASILAQYNPPFEQLQYIIELDRRGSDDAVFYDCANDEFTKYIEKFGFSENWGSFSDISMICPSWGVAGVNLSIGYENEHSPTEILNIGHMLNTIEKVKKMLNQKDIPFFQYIELLNAYHWGNCPVEEEGCVQCHGCGKRFNKEDTYPARLLDGGIGFFCFDCIPDKVGWCDCCTEAFEVGEDGETTTCPYCKQKEGIII